MSDIPNWPPGNWPFPLDLGPFVNQLIPYMDVMQFLYDGFKAVVKAIPHQPPVHTRPVNGYITPWASKGEKVPIPIGSVGYDASTRLVLWKVDKSGKYPQTDLKMEVSSVIPVIFALIIMIPWDGVGELETLAGNAAGMDKPPNAAQMVGWLYDKLREQLKSWLGLSLPKLNGDYSSNSAMPGLKILPTFSDLALHNIPVIDLCQYLYDAVMELVETWNHQPPVYSKDVYAGGVYVTPYYIVTDEDGAENPTETFMGVEDGQTLKVMARFKDDRRGQIGEDMCLLEHTFGAASITLTATASENGSDPAAAAGKDITGLLGLPDGVRSVILDVQQGTEDTPASLTIAVTNTTSGDIIIFSASNTFQLWAKPVSTIDDIIFTAEENGTVSAVTGDVTLFVTPALPAGVTAIAISMIQGKDQAQDALPGDDPGEPARITVQFYNTTASPVALSGSYAMTLDNKTFRSPDITLDLPAAGSAVQYTMDIPNAVLKPKLHTVRVDFADTPLAVRLLPRWRETIDYVGDVFNINWRATDGAGTGSGESWGRRRYLHARLTYTYEGDNTYRTAYTETPQQVPHGDIKIASIGYDAVARRVMVTMTRGEGQVSMGTNSVIWFLLNLLLLIPISIV